jgi:alpha-glucosidase
MDLIIDAVHPPIASEHHYQEAKDPIEEEIPAIFFNPLPAFQSLEVAVPFNATIEGVNGVLFYPPNLASQETAQKEEVPYFHFLAPPQINSSPATSRLDPYFSDEKGSFGVEIKIEAGSHWYGGGEQSRNLCLNNSQFITWNTDCYAYNQKTPSLYQSHPFVMQVRRDGTANGIIANSTYPLLFEMTESHLRIVSHSNPIVPFSIFIFEGKSPQEIVSKLATMTGFMPMPPKWSIGYHQCRWSYYPDSVALDVAKKFREESIPCDVIWFDIHYMNGYRVFTFDKEHFPDPNVLNQDLHKLGFHTVWMIDPGVKQEKGYSVYDECAKNGYAVLKKKDATETDEERDFVGGVWPGPCVFPDFTMEETRKWWSDLYKDYLPKGIDGVWNDMNEPACFNQTKTMDLEAWHRGFGGGYHSKFHNVYGMLMIRATREGIVKHEPNKRPFVLSRANFLGGQRYGAAWTGDNVSNWNHLALSIPMALNMGLSGQPFVGPDIGGFANEADAALFSRWMGFGALLPFARGHTHEDTFSHEPWCFGEETTFVSRIAISRRYRLLPYYYTYFYFAAKTGLPVVRPLFFVDPTDPNLREVNYSFMVGEDVMVTADVLKERDETYEPYHPTNHRWYPLVLDDVKHPDLPTIHVRGGGIVTLQEVQQFVNEREPQLSLVIALDDTGKAYGQYYNDRGNGYDYLNGEYSLLSFKSQLTGTELALSIEAEGKYEIPSTSPVHVTILTPNNAYHRTISGFSQTNCVFQLNE